MMTEVSGGDSSVLAVTYDLLLIPISRAVDARSAVARGLHVVVVVVVAVCRPLVSGQRRVTAAA